MSMTDSTVVGGPTLAQERRIVTPIPGPRSQELLDRKSAAVASGERSSKLASVDSEKTLPTQAAICSANSTSERSRPSRVTSRSITFWLAASRRAASRSHAQVPVLALNVIAPSRCSVDRSSLVKNGLPCVFL